MRYLRFNSIRDMGHDRNLCRFGQQLQPFRNSTMGFMISMTSMPCLVRDVICPPRQEPEFIRIVLAMVNFHLQEARRTVNQVRPIHECLCHLLRHRIGNRELTNYQN